MEPMSVIDVDKLLQEISAEAPCGADLVYDPTFQEMIRAAQGRPERRMGDSIAPAEEPDWGQVRKLALSLLARSKDLRVALYLTRALLNTHGYAGLSDGLSLIRGLLERYWETLYPQLDPDDDDDPTERVNTLLDLCGRETLLHAARATPLVNSRVLGSFALRDIEIASGATPAPAESDGPSADMATINAAFLDGDLDALRATHAAVSDILANARSIEAVVTQRVGAAEAPDLGALTRLMGDAQQLLRDRLGQRDTPTREAAPSAAAGAAEAAGSDATVGQDASAPRLGGEVRNREDVIRLLDGICQYYASCEPSSPVPLLLQRARRLVTKDFLEIVRDLAPDATAQIEAIRGPEGDKT